MKCRLVEDGRAHGFLVYAGGEPVGWCQFGSANELPLMARGRYIDPRSAGPRTRLFAEDEERLWKITCLCTRPDHSQQGVTGVALRAALRSIAALTRTDGRFSEEMEEHLRNRVQVTEFVEGIGEVDATYHGRGSTAAA